MEDITSGKYDLVLTLAEKSTTSTMGNGTNATTLGFKCALQTQIQPRPMCFFTYRHRCDYNL